VFSIFHKTPKVLKASKKEFEHTIFKEAPNFSKTVRRKLFEIVVMAIFRIISTYCYYFVITFSL
jgi:hypothetical protein